MIHIHPINPIVNIVNIGVGACGFFKLNSQQDTSIENKENRTVEPVFKSMLNKEKEKRSK